MLPFSKPLFGPGRLGLRIDNMNANYYHLHRLVFFRHSDP